MKSVPDQKVEYYFRTCLTLGCSFPHLMELRSVSDPNSPQLFLSPAFRQSHEKVKENEKKDQIKMFFSAVTRIRFYGLIPFFNKKLSKSSTHQMH